MKKKNIIIWIIIFLVLIVAVIIFGLKQKNKNKLIADIDKDLYEVVETSGAMYKGKSVISKEQNIFIDKMLDLDKLHVKSAQKIKKGSEIISYKNNAIAEQIKSLEFEIKMINDKISRSKKNKSKILCDIEKKEKNIRSEEWKLKRLKNDIKYDSNDPKLLNIQSKKTKIQQDIQMSKQEVKMFESNLKAEDSVIIGLNDNSKSLNQKLENLKSKLVKKVIADIDGVIYINDEGLSNPAIPYIKVVSEEPLIKGDASEYDVLELKVGKEVNLRVLSTGENIKGKITSIDEIPTASSVPNSNSVVYNFYIKPEKSIRIGFSVEIKDGKTLIEIPKECVRDENGKLYIARKKENGFERVEIDGVLESDYYLLKSNNVKVGDKLSKKPLDALKEK